MPDDVEMSEQEETITVKPISNDNMEVAVVADARTSDLLKGEYTWKIENFSQFPQKGNSPKFEIGGYTWSLLLFPQGNNNSQGNISIYLVAENDNQSNVSCSRSASFKLHIINQANPEESIVKDSRHDFSPEQNDWGFTSFHPLSDLLDPSKSFLVNDTFIIKVEVDVSLPDDFSYFNSRETTGFVGLKNQGATCYMNSLLQTLYNINEFRKSVYRMPTSEDSTPSESMPLALQSVFWKLQFADAPVSTEDLTKSFGWDTLDAFQQHDVQELNRILCESLEEKMKGTRVEGTINHLFEGHTLNYIDCINIEYKSTRREAFQDLQLDVKSCKNIYDSFDRYCEVETLEGDNKYEAEGHGKQDAKKGVLFDALPPVLNLQLKRFEYDFNQDMMVKINDRYEFYDELDLDRTKEDGSPAYLSSNADRKIRNKYRLLAVLVHSGGVNGGHYYAFIRPDGENWLRFDDEKVDKSDENKAINDNWGGDGTGIKSINTGVGYGNALRMSKFSNAYMLVYVRESDWDNIMCEVTAEDISEHVRTRLEAEEAEKERLKEERNTAHLYSLIRIATEQDFKDQIGHNLYFDLIDFSRVPLTLKLFKNQTFSDVQEHVANVLGIPVDRQRYWKWANRQNETFRPSSVLQASPTDRIGQLTDRGRSAGRQGELTHFDLFLEIRPENKPFVDVSKSSILLFFKRYFPGNTTTAPRLEYSGRFIFSGFNKVSDAMDVFRSVNGLPKEAPLRVLEEVKSRPSVMIEPLDLAKPLAECKLETGDIMLFQEEAKENESEFPRVEEFMKYVINRVSVSFKPKNTDDDDDDNEDENEDDAATAGKKKGAKKSKNAATDDVPMKIKKTPFDLDLFFDMSYDDVSKAVADHLKLDHPLRVRLTLYNQHTKLPRAQPIFYGKYKNLEEMIRPSYYDGFKQSNPILFYEVIDRPLPEFERLAKLKIAYHNKKHDEIKTIIVSLPKDSRIADVLEVVRREIPQEEHGDAPLRFMDIYQWKIWQVYDPNAIIESSITPGSINHWRVEAVPEDQRDIDQAGHLHVQCLQLDESQTKTAFPCSDPFIMALGEKETVGELKARVKAEMEISDEDFEKWKVVIVDGQRMSMEALDDDDAVLTEKLNGAMLDGTKLYGHVLDRQMIGFVHENKNPRRTHAHIRNTQFYGQDRQLRIKA